MDALCNNGGHKRRKTRRTWPAYSPVHRWSLRSSSQLQSLQRKNLEIYQMSSLRDKHHKIQAVADQDAEMKLTGSFRWGLNYLVQRLCALHRATAAEEAGRFLCQAENCRLFVMLTNLWEIACSNTN